MRVTFLLRAATVSLATLPVRDVTERTTVIHHLLLRCASNKCHMVCSNSVLYCVMKLVPALPLNFRDFSENPWYYLLIQ